MKSTLYLKFILLYIILGFLSIFTVASLSSTLTTHYLESSISGNMYQSANLLASNYLPDYFSKTIALADVYTQLNGMSDYLNSDIWFVSFKFTCSCCFEALCSSSICFNFWHDVFLLNIDNLFLTFFS